MPPKVAAVARTFDSDPAFMILYYTHTIKHEDGKPDWNGIKDKTGLPTAEAVKKRYERLMKLQNDAESTVNTPAASATKSANINNASAAPATATVASTDGAALGSTGATTTTKPRTPKRARGKKGDMAGVGTGGSDGDVAGSAKKKPKTAEDDGGDKNKAVGEDTAK